ncbi:aldo/keto reductase [Paraflavisolibacter sp. H34]|uniref:aldo/keto reductase n=1 Tax=Huijunlia imazamoxiresistens TaxID=3127457 RepID=UPI0030184148
MRTNFSDLPLPAITFGTSGLGNLYTALPDDVKLEIIRESIRHSEKPVVFDSAGKYGAGLALETLGKCLKQLNVKPDEVIISNKLAWVRSELKTPEPTFEPGVWKDLKFDAVQKISYDGILECFEQGNELLQGYHPQLVSVHDPDEYLATARNPEEEQELYGHILEAYRALFDLKKEGRVLGVGVGAKNWRSIERIAADVPLDWVMIANSMTIKSHPPELTAFMEHLRDRGVKIINSAVFHGGFLIGGDFYDYRPVSADTEEGRALFQWREDFFALCKEFGITPAAACVQFGLKAPGVASIALSTSSPGRVKDNVALAHAEIPAGFWTALKEKGLIRQEYAFV